MKNNEEINWKSLAKHLAGESDAKEQQEISAWIERSSSNADLYNEISAHWNQINNMKEMNQFDVNNGWEKLHNRIVVTADSNVKAGSTGPRKQKSLLYMPLFRAAAAIALLILIGAGTYGIVSKIKRDAQLATVSSGSDDKTKVTLPDGTEVFLNADTKITYSKSFNGRTREVRLTGEAYFDVTHNPDKPFLIYTGDAIIKVLGTSFNVQAFRSSGKVEVYVETGKVQLYEAQNTSNVVTIEPGYVGSIKKSMVEKSRNTNENYMAWKTKKLFFNNSEMGKVAAGIQDVFKVKMVFENPAMEHCKISSNFMDESLEDVLKSICTLHNWKWERKGDTVILSGTGC